MNIIKKGTLFFIVLLFCYGSSSSLFACPCFNSIFLQSIFKSNATTECDIYRKGNVIYKIDIYNKEHVASSTSTNCMINTEHHDVFTDFYPDYHGDHNQCIKAILDACNNMKENVVIKDY